MSEPPTVDRHSPNSSYDMGLERGPANYVPLTPLSFLDRAATVYPQRTAVVYGQRRMDYAAFRDRCRRLAAALADAGVGQGDTVSALLPNIPEMLECHYGVPMTGAVLNAVNTRLDAASVAFFLQHARSKVFIADRGFAPVVRAALAELEEPPLLVEVDDPAHGGDSL
ncbi:MAG: AMP-binding protein, partial [Alphaproteobacteria bacterium]|nr:AMP-binding protein [Alphaproteobacteria bacterium]